MKTKRKGTSKTKVKKKFSWIINGIKVKSREELWFAMWLEECKDHGIVVDWKYESPTFPLSTNINYMGANLDQSKSITPDYMIEWSPTYQDRLYYNCSGSTTTKSKDKPLFIVYNNDCSSNTSYIDVKPVDERRNSSSVSFPYKRSWLLNSQGIWIQKVKPFGVKNLQKGDIGGLFNSTFTPTSIINSGDLKCDVGARKGKLYAWVKWKIINFNDWYKTI